jgi:hypothetical protein
VPISDVFPDYTFYSVTDSAVAKYWVSNITHNGARVYLDNWCQGKSVDIEEMTIPQSRTKTVRIAPGDRVKIFREFWWYEPYTKAINPGAYLGTTNESYSIEILDAVSVERIAQLDTLFLRAKNESSAPYFFSLYPAMALIEYEYPTHLPERNIVIAIRATQRGKANFPLYRIDGIAISHTRDLQSDTWKKYAADLEQLTIAPRSLLLPLSQMPDPKRNFLQVTTSEQSINMSVKVIPPVGSIVRISDIYSEGNKVVPINTIQSHYSVEIQKSGVYIVTLYNSAGAMIESHKIYYVNQK